MKTGLLILACGLLTACATSRYVAVQPEGAGGYYIAQSPAVSNQLRREAGYYSPFYAYGLYPWWGYSYYSPNFYPHYFSLSYPSWPCYGGGNGDCCGAYPFGIASHGDYLPGPFPARTSTVPAAQTPALDLPVRVVAPTIVPQERGRLMGSRERRGQLTRSGIARSQPVELYSLGSHEPLSSSAVSAPAIRSFDSVNRTSLPSFSRPPPGSGRGSLGREAGRTGQATDRSPLKRRP
jgi:hypothetical protein